MHKPAGFRFKVIFTVNHIHT